MRKLFLDTSIQIAREIHAPQIKQQISARLNQYDTKVTSLVVKQEYKRRLLSEAVYLLNQIERRKSLNTVRWHIEHTLASSYNQRKARINISLLLTVEDKLRSL